MFGHAGVQSKVCHPKHERLETSCRHPCQLYVAKCDFSPCRAQNYSDASRHPPANKSVSASALTSLSYVVILLSLSLSVCTRQLRSNSLQSSISSRICRIVMPQCSGQTSIHAPFLRAFGVHVGSPSLTQACSSICSQILARWL